MDCLNKYFAKNVYLVKCDGLHVYPFKEIMIYRAKSIIAIARTMPIHVIYLNYVYEIINYESRNSANTEKDKILILKIVLDI